MTPPPRDFLDAAERAERAGEAANHTAEEARVHNRRMIWITVGVAVLIFAAIIVLAVLFGPSL